MHKIVCMALCISLIPRPFHVFQRLTLKNMGKPGYEATHNLAAPQLIVQYNYTPFPPAAMGKLNLVLAM